jgi:hypothetical protein
MSHATTIPGNRLPWASPSIGRTPANSHTIENPLWVIVIGMACFFSVAALVIAAS